MTITIYIQEIKDRKPKPYRFDPETLRAFGQTLINMASRAEITTLIIKSNEDRTEWARREILNNFYR